MSDRGYIGMEKDGVVTARYLHGADEPEILVPKLRAIWDGLQRDSHRLCTALLAEDWSYLSTDQSGPYINFVPGVGCPSPGGTSPKPARIPLAGPISAYLGWLYVIAPDSSVITVYEATVHDRWLRHSVHELRTDR
ncbi:hypothetical protein AB0368_06720 [Actinoplanes sp. NPDC051475]|uniref:hypothetical protein n=1 Tax=Actinoplanes sp. NPDC051475 TaxID=3157225 RepID=UPI00344CAB8A